MPVSQAPTEPQSDQAQRVRAQEAALRSASRTDRAAEAGRGAPAANTDPNRPAPSDRPPGKADGAHFTPPPEGTPEYSFADLVDVVNPLQHIPGVASVYQEVTGDEIKGASQVVGSTLYGGPIGLIGGAANAIIDEATGDDVGGHTLAALGMKEPESAGDTRLASGSGDPQGQPPASEATIARTSSTTKAVELASQPSQQAAASTDGQQPQDRGVHIAAASTGTTGRQASTAATATDGAPQANGVATGDNALAKVAQDLRQGGGQADQAQRQGASAQATAAQGSTDGNGNGVARGDAALSQLANDLRQGGTANTNAQASGGAQAGDTATRGEQPSPTQTQTARAADVPSDSDFFQIKDRHYTHSAEQNARDAAQRLEAAANTEAVPGQEADAATAYKTGESAPDAGQQQRRTASSASGNEPLPTPETQGMPENFAERMKNALDKYRAMQQAQ
ncbi:hypothetical protein SAMN05216241_10786 [Limimonas halophila]|uniref:Uncharacterized protein n=1 Tax=Limimonas halophila TaxID=1082479 RepID=A0A1G7SNT5_9PROT|nr:hypothetical protein [Limimonas halophila]SDG24693.1 hypothetical protein SAMN05216241_10786 [Limimonas halophila]